MLCMSQDAALNARNSAGRSRFDWAASHADRSSYAVSLACERSEALAGVTAGDRADQQAAAADC